LRFYDAIVLPDKSSLDVTVQPQTSAQYGTAFLMMAYDSLSIDLRETADTRILLPVWHV